MLPSDASGSADHIAGSPRIRSVGKPAFGIRDEDNKALARGEIGEVCVRGGHVMREYRNKKEATEEASGAMKVLKKDLRAPFWEGHEKKIG